MVTDEKISFVIFVYDNLSRLVNEASFSSFIGIDAGNIAAENDAKFFYTSLTEDVHVIPNDVTQRNDSIFYRIDGS